MMEEILKTPDELLTEIIINALLKEKLILDEDLKNIGPKISSGSLSQDDWRLCIEKPVLKLHNGGSNGPTN